MGDGDFSSGGIMSGGARQRGGKIFFSLWVVVWGRGDLRAVFANEQFLRPVA